MLPSWKKHLKRFWKGCGYALLVSFIIATSFKSVIADWNVVPTGSMRPTIVEGDRIFINKLAYDLKVPYTTLHIAAWDAPRAGEIVVFNSPVDGRRLVKRVVGVPGDIVSMVDNRLIINGRAITYVPIDPSVFSNLSPPPGSDQIALMENLWGSHHPVMLTPRTPSMTSFGPAVVPDGHYFMMGDNRDNSADSRFFGFVARDRIVGRATAVVISFNILDRYQPRWKRFFTGLP